MAIKGKRARIFDKVLIILMFFVIVVTLFPFLNVLAKSLNDASDTVLGGITIYPRKPTFKNFIDLFAEGSNLPVALKNSAIRTIVTSLLHVLCCSMFAFPLSRKDFVFKKAFMTITVVTMYVSGGLIPSYMLIRSLGMMNNFLVYIIPGLISAWDVILIRSFIQNIPTALQEAAIIDGANDCTVFFKIIFPMCMPVMATILLFSAVGNWNDWFTTYIYMSGKKRTTLSTMQYELMKVLDSVNTSGKVDIHSEGLKLAKRSPEAIRMAITVVCTVPILVVYPFVQRYFVTGITLGSVKE